MDKIMVNVWHISYLGVKNPVYWTDKGEGWAPEEEWHRLDNAADALRIKSLCALMDPDPVHSHGWKRYVFTREEFFAVVKESGGSDGQA